MSLKSNAFKLQATVEYYVRVCHCYHTMGHFLSLGVQLAQCFVCVCVCSHQGASKICLWCLVRVAEESQKNMWQRVSRYH